MPASIKKHIPLVRFDRGGNIIIAKTHDDVWVELLYRCLLPGGSELFFNTFLSESFKGAWCRQRQEHLRRFEDEELAKAWVMGFRSFSKTTMLWGLMVKNACFRRQPFTMYTSRTHDYAADQCDNVKGELLGNPLIREVFGKMKPVATDGMNPTFSKRAYFLSDPISSQPFAFVLPKGEGQQCNGSIVRIMGGMERPTFLASDDGEDREAVLVEEQRAKHTAWYWGAYVRCVPAILPNAETNKWNLKKVEAPKEYKDFWVITPGERAPYLLRHQDTCKHEASNMMEIASSEDWFGESYPAGEYRDDGLLYSLVPEVYTTKQLRKEEKFHRDKGWDDLFAMEFMCTPQAKKKHIWGRDGFQYYNDVDMGLNWSPHVRRFINMDPSRTATHNSSETSILAWAVDPGRAHIYLRKHVCRRMTPDEQEEELFRLCEETNTTQVIVEETGLKLWIQSRFENAASKRDYPVDWIWIEGGSTPRGDYGSGKNAIKKARASQILPFYAPGPYHPKGHVWHDMSFKNGPLEQAELSFPRNKQWDGMDTLGYVPQVMGEMGILFQPQSKPAILEPTMQGELRMRDYGHDIAERNWAVCA